MNSRSFRIQDVSAFISFILFWFSVICSVAGLFVGGRGPGGGVCNCPEEQKIRPVERRGKAFCLLCEL